MERLEQPAAPLGVAGHDQPLDRLEAAAGFGLGPRRAVRRDGSEARLPPAVARSAGKVAGPGAREDALDARAVELEVERGRRGRCELGRRQHLDPLEYG